jgi:hypothetical protein
LIVLTLKQLLLRVVLPFAFLPDCFTPLNYLLLRPYSHSFHQQTLAMGDYGPMIRTGSASTKPSGPNVALKSVFGAKIFKPRSVSNKESTTHPPASGEPHGTVDPRYGSQISITGGSTKPAKSSLAEKAARFGREAFGSRSTSADGNHKAGHYQYTAVKDVPDLCPDSDSADSLISLPPKTRIVPESAASSIYDDETVEPVPSLNIVKNTANIGPALKFQQPRIMPSTTRTTSDRKDSATTVSKMNIKPSQSHFSWTTYADTERSVSPADSYEEDTARKMGADGRFNWTTTSTYSTCQQNTPPCTPPRSIISRKRPVAPTQVISHDSLGESQKVKKAAAHGKTLPDAPKAEAEIGRVDSLMSRLQSLELQKRNTDRVLQELQKVESASPIDVSEKMRRENRRKMGDMGVRQDEVQREIFEVGRLLSRARAKAEETDGSTGLWLRRVTD